MVGVAVETSIAASISVQMTPSHRPRGWRYRWSEIEVRVKEIDRPHLTSMSGRGIEHAVRDLLDFYVLAYHLKDALIGDPNSGLARRAVETAINGSAVLRLLADLANLDKHHRLTQAPRSGYIPQFGHPTGSQPGSGGGWRLHLPVVHAGQTLDGVDIARKAVVAWRNQLQSWALL